MIPLITCHTFTKFLWSREFSLLARARAHAWFQGNGLGKTANVEMLEGCRAAEPNFTMQTWTPSQKRSKNEYNTTILICVAGLCGKHHLHNNMCNVSVVYVKNKMVWTYNSGDGPPTITVTTNIDSLIAQWLCEHLWPVTDTMTGMSYSSFNTGPSRLNIRKKYFPIVYVFACECVGGCTWGAPYIGEEGGRKFEH